MSQRSDEPLSAGNLTGIHLSLPASTGGSAPPASTFVFGQEERLGSTPADKSAPGGQWGPVMNIQVPSQFASWRQSLQFVLGAELAGQLSIDLGPESVLVFVEDGRIIFVGSTDPDAFAAPVRSLFDLQSLSLALLGIAQEAQRATGLPLFLFIHSAGWLDKLLLMNVLQKAGEAAFARVDGHGQYGVRFEEKKLPPFAREFSIDLEVAAVLLASYRRLALGRCPDADARIQSTGEEMPAMESHLSIDELRLLRVVRTGPLRVSDLTENARLAAYVLTRIGLAQRC